MIGDWETTGKMILAQTMTSKMKIRQVIEQLEELEKIHGPSIEVLLSQPQADAIYDIKRFSYEKPNSEEYPIAWRMPHECILIEDMS